MLPLILALALPAGLDRPRPGIVLANPYLQPVRVLGTARCGDVVFEFTDDLCPNCSRAQIPDVWIGGGVTLDECRYCGYIDTVDEWRAYTWRARPWRHVVDLFHDEQHIDKTPR
jgi:Zn ribbon nucleic-acid-binding protein